jgi:ATP-dependent Lon protease
MFVALTSMLTGIPVRPDVAMTGEITLRGNVLPVGGIKEKLLAAHRAGIKRVILPERNKKDIVDVPDEVKKDLEIIHVTRMDEVLPLVLTQPLPSAPAPAEKPAAGAESVPASSAEAAPNN